jgi:hypothetical protein
MSFRCLKCEREFQEMPTRHYFFDVFFRKGPQEYAGHEFPEISQCTGPVIEVTSEAGK